MNNADLFDLFGAPGDEPPKPEGEAPTRFLPPNPAPPGLAPGLLPAQPASGLEPAPPPDLFGASGKWQGAVLTLQRDGGAERLGVGTVSVGLHNLWLASQSSSVAAIVSVVMIVPSVLLVAVTPMLLSWRRARG